MAAPKGKKVLDVDIYARDTEGTALHERHCHGMVRLSITTYTPRHAAQLAHQQRHHRPQVLLKSLTHLHSVLQASEGKGVAVEAWYMFYLLYGSLRVTGRQSVLHATTPL